jgi:carbon storage regulator CsrA
MLVLSRDTGGRVVITVPPSAEPTRVEVLLLKLQGNRARIGFDAPEPVAVHRLEVQELIDDAIATQTRRPVA